MSQIDPKEAGELYEAEGIRVSTYRGVTGWCWTRRNEDGTVAGGVGFASEGEAAAAGMQGG